MKTKSKSEIILTIVILIFIVISFIIDIDKYIPGLSEIFPFVWIFFLIFDIYKSNKYLKNKPKNEIRIRSKNDSYYHILPFIGGSIFCLISLILFFQHEGKATAILTFLSGIILIFKGLIFIPSVLIRNENGNLYLENGKVFETLKIETLEKVIINEGNIEFKQSENKNYIFSHLELNLTEIETAKKFLKENTKANLI
jgi:ABC-type Fe3+-siderophore transport system permease subunit